MLLILDFNSLEVAMISSPFRQLKAVGGKKRLCLIDYAAFYLIGKGFALVNFKAKGSAAVLKMLKKQQIQLKK